TTATASAWTGTYPALGSGTRHAWAAVVADRSLNRERLSMLTVCSTPCQLLALPCRLLVLSARRDLGPRGHFHACQTISSATRQRTIMTKFTSADVQLG